MDAIKPFDVVQMNPLKELSKPHSMGVCRINQQNLHNRQQLLPSNIETEYLLEQTQEQQLVLTLQTELVIS